VGGVELFARGGELLEAGTYNRVVLRIAERALVPSRGGRAPE